MRDNLSATSPPEIPGANAALPIIVLRFPALYAWMVIVFGGLFLLLGLWITLLTPRRNLGMGVFISVVSIAAIIGANYWRHHLHIVAQLTPRELILGKTRGGTINWTEITAIEKKVLHSPKGSSEFICIALKARPATKSKLDSFFNKAKHAVTGFDVIVPASELSCGADWFLAECLKRIEAAGGSSAG